MHTQARRPENITDLSVQQKLVQVNEVVKAEQHCRVLGSIGTATPAPSVVYCASRLQHREGVTSQSQHMRHQASSITPQVKLHTEASVTPKKHCLVLQMMHHCAVLWLKGRTLLSWLAFGTSASAATSRFSSSSRPVFIRYLAAAPAAVLHICHHAAATVMQHSLLYHICHLYAAGLKQSLLYHSCCCCCCCFQVLTSISLPLPCRHCSSSSSSSHFTVAAHQVQTQLQLVQLSRIRCQPVMCHPVTHALNKSIYGVLSRESLKGQRCTLSSRQPMQQRLQHAFRLCGEAEWPDAAQLHCKLRCNDNGSLTGRLLQSRSVMQFKSVMQSRSIMQSRSVSQALSCPS